MSVKPQFFKKLTFLFLNYCIVVSCYVKGGNLELYNYIVQHSPRSHQHILTYFLFVSKRLITSILLFVASHFINISRQCSFAVQLKYKLKMQNEIRARGAIPTCTATEQLIF